MSAQPTVITYATECQLCHKTQQNPPMQISLNGGPTKQQEDFMRKLLMHIATHHATELNNGKQLLAQYQAFLLLSTFQSQDPSVQAVFEGMRADIFQRCRRNVPNAADLDVLANSLGLPDEKTYKIVLDALTAVRDMCCEMGAAAPKTAEGPRLVTP